MSKIAKSKINQQYNKFVIIFFVLAIIIVIFTGYFAFAKTTVVITPVLEKIKSDSELYLDDIDGSFITASYEDVYIYEELSSEAVIEEEGYAEGMITIYNNYEADQPLVATTRLMSESGILFRIQEDIVVPKDGSVEVLAKADEPGVNGDIDPNKFEIVALAEIKKEFIYGESYSKMSGGLVGSTAVTENEIEKAKNSALDAIEEKFDLEYVNNIKDFNVDKLIIDIVNQEVDAEVGQKVNSIAVDSKVNFKYFNVDESLIKTACMNDLQEEVGNNYSTILNENKKISYELKDKYGQQVVGVECNGFKFISANSNLIDKEQLTNRTSNQVKNYLETYDEIQEVEVRFSPFWVKTTPFIDENIILEIKEL